MENNRPKHKCYEGEIFKIGSFEDFCNMIDKLEKSVDTKQSECNCCDCQECETAEQPTIFQTGFEAGLVCAYENIIALLIDRLTE